MPTNTTAVVIGGGFAGVTAARQLSATFDRVVLLEAADRLGGRAYSTDFTATGTVVELGGAWITTRFNPHVRAEIERYGLAVEESHSAQTQFRWGTSPDGYVGGFPVEGDDVWELERIIWEIGQDSRRIDPDVPRDAQDLADLDVSIEDYLSAKGAPDSVRRFFYGWAGIGSGAGPDEWSALTALSWIAAMDHSVFGWFGAVSQKLRDGSGALLHAMLDDSRAEVRLGSPVRAVDQSGDRVVVTLADGEAVEADGVVVATAYNAWGTVDFAPALGAAKSRAAEQPHRGRIRKYWALVDDAPAGLYAVGHDRAFICAGDEGEVPGGRLLVGFCSTPAAVDCNDPAAVQEALREIVPGVTVKACLSHDWEADPWARGTWMVSRPGVLSKHASQLQAMEGRIAFASADTANRWIGWIDGAIESGHRAAEQLAVVAVRQEQSA